MDIQAALDIVARIGGDNPPSLDELSSARTVIARELHALKKGGNSDLEALMSLRETYAVLDAAVTEAEAAETKAAEDVDDLLSDIPDPDAPPENPDGLSTDPEPTPVLPVREAVARLGLVEAEPVVEVVGDRADAPDPLAQVKHTVQIDGDIRDDATFADLAEAFASSGRSLKNGKERVARITSEFAGERTLTGKISDDTRLLDSFMSPEAINSAGGCCVLPTPIFENPVVGSTDRPIKASLNTLGGPRGRVTFFPSICIPQAGSGVWTCEDDEAVDPDDDSTWKDCAEFECDEPEFADIEGIYKCITIGNFAARQAPEQWAGVLKALAVSQARMAEVNLFDKMRAATTSTHTGLATGSTYLNVVNTALRATALMRQDQRLANVQFKLWAPEWVTSAIAEGFGINRMDKGAGLEDVRQLVAEALAREGITTVYSLDIDDLEGFQYDGALADYPATASTVLAPEGYFTFLDAGQFDLGTDIRDHDLNRQNKVGAFAESFEGLMARGCNAKSLDIPVECDLTLACPA